MHGLSLGNRAKTGNGPITRGYVMFTRLTVLTDDDKYKSSWHWGDTYKVLSANTDAPIHKDQFDPFNDTCMAYWPPTDTYIARAESLSHIVTHIWVNNKPIILAIGLVAGWLLASFLLR